MHNSEYFIEVALTLVFFLYTFIWTYCLDGEGRRTVQPRLASNEFLGSSNPPASASQIARTSVMSYCGQPFSSFPQGSVGFFFYPIFLFTTLSINQLTWMA